MMPDDVSTSQAPASGNRDARALVPEPIMAHQPTEPLA
jgi:hypothetical protein